MIGFPNRACLIAASTEDRCTEVPRLLKLPRQIRLRAASFPALILEDRLTRMTYPRVASLPSVFESLRSPGRTPQASGDPLRRDRS